MKKFVAVLLGLAVVFGSATSGRAANIPDEQWSIMKNLFDLSADKTGISLQGLSIQDNTNLSERVSNMVGRAPGIDGDLGFRLCKSADDSFCTEGRGQHLEAFLPVCANASELNCIVGVSAIKDGLEIKGIYGRNFPAHGYTDFPADPEKNVPEGSTPSIWSFPGLIHGGGTNQYLASFVVTGGFNQDGKVNIDSYYATLNAVSIEAGDWGRNKAKDGSGKSLPSCLGHCGMEMEGTSHNDKFVCASLDDGFCALRQAFPSNVRFKIEARLSQSPTGWFHGRLKSPDIKILNLTKGVSISIEAEPVTVPVVGILQDYSKLPEEMQKTYATPSGFQWGTGTNASIRGNSLSMPSPDSQEAFEAVKIWKDYINDRANASPIEWAVRTLSTGGSTAQCLKSSNELVGIVTTNSMVYLGTPPTFDKESQSLDYKVSSPHFTSRGEVFKGTYDLQLRSDVARCLYGFSNAPISAKISIISESGEANVATTVVNEKDGWMKMAAYGFTFSSPTVKVKLTQESVNQGTAAPSTSAAPVKKSITCVKGKSMKKVTATNPKCPPGYKKKVA